jgi:hypothetical protein
MLVQAALRQQDADNQRLDHGADHTAAAQPLHREPDYRRHTDQHDHRDDAALPPAAFAAARPIELAVEKADRPPGQHDRVRDMSKHRRQIAEQRIECEAGEQQQQPAVIVRKDHRPANLGYAAAAGNRRGARG